MKRVMVTGSAGFIGSHVVEALRARGDSVVSADRKTGANLEVPAASARLIKQWKPEYIVHLASSCSTPGSVANPWQTFEDTVVTAANVLEQARWYNLPVLITSSVKARDGMTPYGAAKRMVETWALEYRAAYGLPVVINRPGTVYGPGQEGSEESGWIAWFCEARDRGATVTINGDGEQRRDLLHVSDYVRLVLLQLDNVDRFNTGVVYDVGGGPRNTVTVNQIVAHLGLKHRYGPARYGDAREYVALNDVPGWEPQVAWETSETLA
jgi:nucleoside-diphosphate-sugar epimerase